MGAEARVRGRQRQDRAEARPAGEPAELLQNRRKGERLRRVQGRVQHLPRAAELREQEAGPGELSEPAARRLRRLRILVGFRFLGRVYVFNGLNDLLNNSNNFKIILIKFINILFYFFKVLILILNLFE